MADSEMKDKVGIALDTPHIQATPEERDALVRTSLGLQRMMVDPTGGLPGALALSLGLPSVPDQLAQTVVYYWRDGRRNSPPFVDRPVMRPIIEERFHIITPPVPTPALVVIKTLVDVAIGLIQDCYPNAHGGVKHGVSDLVVRAYVEGA